VQVDSRGLTSAPQQEAFAYVSSTVLGWESTNGKQLDGWLFTIDPYPVVLPYPERDPFPPYGVITEATSYTNFSSQHVALSWQEVNGMLDIQDLKYELANVSCGCESGIK
jgi:hypothetical protein